MESLPLELFICSEIAEKGSMTFARFMEVALYHPEFGYYTAPQAAQRIGRGGDFYTSVSVGETFGALLAHQFTEMWEAMGKPFQFNLLELGAHRGQLAEDVQGWIERMRPEFLAALRYETRDYPGELPMGVQGCIYSNELVDSMPVHRVTFHAGEWFELFVVEREEGLVLLPAPLSSEELAAEIQRLPLPPIEGYTTEIHLAARRWIEGVAASLERGFVLTIDYGLSAEEYYAPHRKDGTLLCFERHRTNNAPLERVGQQDITAHVNFTSLVEQGTSAGLEMLGFTDQSRFIAGLMEKANLPMDPKRVAQLKTLLHPELMGRTFKVLVQQRGMAGTQLSGLKFARDYVF